MYFPAAEVLAEALAVALDVALAVALAGVLAEDTVEAECLRFVAEKEMASELSAERRI